MCARIDPTSRAIDRSILSCRTAGVTTGISLLGANGTMVDVLPGLSAMVMAPFGAIMVSVLASSPFWPFFSGANNGVIDCVKGLEKGAFSIATSASFGVGVVYPMFATSLGAAPSIFSVSPFIPVTFCCEERNCGADDVRAATSTGAGAAAVCANGS